jgi:hypothetical protein
LSEEIGNRHFLILATERGKLDFWILSYGTWKETIFNFHLQASKKGFGVSILYRETHL